MKVLSKKKLTAIAAALVIVMVNAVSAGVYEQRSVQDDLTPGTLRVGVVVDGSVTSANVTTTASGAGAYGQASNTITLTNNNIDNGNVVVNNNIWAKNVYTNTSSADLYVRITCDPMYMSGFGSYTYEVYGVFDEVPSASADEIVSNGNIFYMGDMGFKLADDWQDYWTYVYGEGYGCFYYNKPLKPDEETSVLFTAILMDEDAYDYGIDDYGLLYIRAKIMAEGIQTVGSSVENRWTTSPDTIYSLDIARPKAYPSS